MANFQSYCSFPVYCRDCQKLSVANLLAGKANIVTPKHLRAFFSRLKEIALLRSRRHCPEVTTKESPRCGNCGSENIVPYDSKELMKIQGRTVESWNVQDRLGRVLILTDGKYFCPQCNKFEMTFLPGSVCWD
jgi:hypothetical protein